MYDIEDAATDYIPVWLDGLRGFQDLRAIEAKCFNNVLQQHLPLEVIDWICDHKGWTFSLQDAQINVHNERVGHLKVIASSDTMPRKVLDSLRVGVRSVPILSDGITWSSTSFAICLLQVIEEAISWQQEWHKHIGRVAASPTPGWDSQGQCTWTSILSNPTGVDLLTVEDKAAHLLGEPIADICSRVSEDIRILHIEPVFRSDLVSRHLKAKARIHQYLLAMSKHKLRKSVPFRDIRPGSTDDTVPGLAAHLARPSVTFHGAPRHVMNSIVRYGFVLPGKEIGHSGQALEVRCGSTFGRGVYSSPDLMYASSYTQYQSGTSLELNRPSDVPGFRIVVCATLMGRALQVSRGEARGVEGLLSEDAHSHVSPSQLEYIVFDTAQIIPCYVLHLDYGAERARAEFERLVANPVRFFERREGSRKVENKWANKDEEAPGDVQRKKEALKAAAGKWFPYGMVDPS